MDRKTMIVAALAAVIFGALGFGGGTMLARSSAAAGGNFAGRQGMMAAAGQNAARAVSGNVAFGNVTEKSADSFTIKMPDGSTRTVYYSKSTTFSKTESATIDDVSVGTTVTAIGQSTDDSGVTAQRVQLGDQFGPGGARGFFGGQRTGGSGGPGAYGGGGGGNRMMFGGPPPQ